MPTVSLLSERPRFSSGDWGDVLLVAEDPLAAWKSDFAEWLNNFEEFRAMEESAFFPDIHDPLASRVHRGWLCTLISKGEWLAVELLQHGDGEITSEKRVQLGFIDAFLLNLRSDLSLWHSGEEIEAALRSDCKLH